MFNTIRQRTAAGLFKVIRRLEEKERSRHHAEIRVTPPEAVAQDARAYTGDQRPTKVVEIHEKIVEIHEKIVESLAPMARRCLIENPVP